MPRVARGAAVSTNRGKEKKEEENINEDDDTKDNKNPNKYELPMQTRIRETYASDKVQMTVAAVIFLNFITSAVAAQIVPAPGSAEEQVFYVFEVLFAILFGFELIWNMYGSWFVEFWKSGWNIFDFVIVIIAILGLAMRDLPGISVLRLFRAFRVFRLFKRIKSLKFIIEGVIASIPGVANGFMVLLIIMGIWSIMGTEFFGNIPDCQQEFGNFLKSMFSMWQIMSGDSWASGIARKVIFDNDLPYASVFFITYLMLASIIMLNVILAIFFEKYLGYTEEGDNNTVSMPNFDEASREQLLVLLTEVLSPHNLENLDEDEILDLTKVVSTHSTSAFSILLSQGIRTRKLSNIPSDGSTNMNLMKAMGAKGKSLILGNSSSTTTKNTDLNISSKGNVEVIKV